jgi:hypothetical protein
MPDKERSADLDLSFKRGAVGSRHRVWILAIQAVPEGAVPDVAAEHTWLLRYDAGQWERTDLPWKSATLLGRVKPELELLVFGIEGTVLRMTQAGAALEHVDSSDRGPRGLGILRDARWIEGVPVAVGMSRQVYQRERAGSWVHIDAGTLTEEEVLAGFNGVDGFSLKDIYAVGFEGEVWHYDGAHWEQYDSPTNLALTRVRCVAPDAWYAVGVGGIVLRGHGDRFEAVPQDNTQDNLFGVEWFNDRLYVASLKNVYVLKGNELKKIDLGLGDEASTGDLHANDGILWSTGAHHLVYTEDGTSWTRVLP